MSTEENKAIARRVFEEVWNEGDLDVVDEIFAADFVMHGTAAVSGGVEALKQRVARMHTAFPDLHMVIEDQIAEGDKVVTRWTASGTQKGEMMGSPPTGKQFTNTGITIERFAGGKVVEAWGNSDDLGVFRQLGFELVPPKGEGEE